MDVRTRYFTWNPMLHFQLLRGGPSDFDDELRRRTVTFQFVDRARAFDSIEWTMDNTDGKLIRPEYLALGLIVRIRLGYAGCEAPWRTFLLNRLRGDPGVYGARDTATGQALNVHHGRAHTAAQVTYTGRNRNAPAPKKGQSKTKKGTKYYGSTSDVTGQDYAIVSSGGTRVFPGRTTSECVRNIAAALGFFETQQLVQNTQDQRTDLRIPNNVPDGIFLQQLARTKGFIFRIDADGFHFHHPAWSGGKGKSIQREYTVGGQDVIKISIDGDFRMPIPTTVRAVGRDVVLRHTNVSEATATAGELIVKDLLPANLPSGQMANLQRAYVIPVADAGRMADDKATRNFINAKLRSYKIVVDIVGDPLVQATNSVKLSGTNSPLVDGVWYVEEVKHQFSGQGGQTYVSTLTLKQPPKTVPGNVLTLNHANASQPTVTGGELHITNAPAALLKTAATRK